MPFGDRTGPRGQGPMSGRSAGYCAGYDVPGYVNWGPGCARRWGGGWRGGGGRSMRYRHWFYATGMPGWMRAGCAPWWAPGPHAAPMAAADEENILEQRARVLRDELEVLEERLEALRVKGRPGEETQGG